MMERYFTIDMPFWRFLLNTLVVSCAGLFSLLLLYVGLIPRFGPELLNNGLAMRLFLRQVVTNGLPVVFIVNYLGFFIYAVLAARPDGEDRLTRVLLIDPPLRVFVFIVLHGLIYFLSADWFGSFGGDHWLALRVVAPTLARAGLFTNLSGVYLYATLGSAVPIYTAAIEPLLAPGTRLRGGAGELARMPQSRRVAVLLALGLFVGVVLLLSGVSIAIEYLQPS